MVDLFQTIKVFFPIVSIILGISYFFLILIYFWGWKKLSPANRSVNRSATTVSIVVAVRNEAVNIPALIRALKSQDYPKELMEVLFIDDHSTDSTRDAIHLCVKGETVYSILSSSGVGKKDALQCGYSKCRGDLIITTDADCTFNQKWISALVSCFEDKKADFIIGPVILDEGPGIFQDLQALEFLSLTGTAGGSAGIGKPILCNGANLAFKANIVSSQPDLLNRKFASGDDIFLLQHVKKEHGCTPVFLKSREATVVSKGQDDLKSFWNQRKRWTSKNRGCRDFDSAFAAIIVYLTNLFLLVSLILSFFIPQVFLIFIGLFLLKSIPDFLFMYTVTEFFDKKPLLRYFLILQVLYFFYVSIIPIAGTIGKFSWKDRVYK